jgi:hypothetical protein
VISKTSLDKGEMTPKEYLKSVECRIAEGNLKMTNQKPASITDFKIQDQTDKDFAQEATYTLMIAPKNPIPKNGAVKLTLPDNIRFSE